MRLKQHKVLDGIFNGPSTVYKMEILIISKNALKVLILLVIWNGLSATNNRNTY